MNELTEIGRKYGTDKSTTHNYTEKFYHTLFNEHKHKPIKILELGVGQSGASHKMWSEYFPNGKVFCLDPFFRADGTVTPEELENEFNVSVVKGNQLNRDDLRKIAEMGEEFDYIIDDASHISDAIQISLGVLFPYLKKGGIYIIEDLWTARDRATRLDKVNEWLISNKVIQEEKPHPLHSFDHDLIDTLRKYDETKTWESTQLTEEESQYLVDNILTWRVYDDNHYKDNFGMIEKR